MPDPYALPTLILAFLAVVVGLVSLVVLFVFRHRDRVELEVVAIEDHGDEIHIKIRNHGGTPTRIAGVFFTDGESSTLVPRAGGYPSLAGRTTVTVRTDAVALRRQPRVGDAVYVQDEAGRVSKSRPIPSTIAARITPA